jgi:S1-C subfamily serine protease
MNRKWLLTALAVTLVLPAALAAQEAPARQAAHAPRGESRVLIRFQRSARSNRRRRGRQEPESDKYGARIDAITPGGPAEAGIKAGDIITKFNGTSLAGVARGRGRLRAGMRLVDLAHELEPGDTVRVEYRRGSETKSATLVAEDLNGFAWTGVVPRMAMPTPRLEMGDLGPLVPAGRRQQLRLLLSATRGAISTSSR